jgi:S1-C subfamily serine protease
MIQGGRVPSVGRRLLAAVLISSLSSAVFAPSDGVSRALAAPTAPSTELSADEQATIAVFERATRSVVFIANTTRQRDPWSFNVFEVPQGSGTGFVWSRQGHIVTNFHVIYEADAITVTLADQVEYKAKVVGVDPDHDIAVLQIHAPEDALQPVTIGKSLRARPHAHNWGGQRPRAHDQIDDQPYDRRRHPD